MHGVQIGLAVNYGVLVEDNALLHLIQGEIGNLRPNTVDINRASLGCGVVKGSPRFVAKTADEEKAGGFAGVFIFLRPKNS
jgi:hypothetical protein